MASPDTHPIYREILDEIIAQVKAHPGIPWASNGGPKKPSIQNFTVEAVAARGTRTETVRSRTLR